MPEKSDERGRNRRSSIPPNLNSSGVKVKKDTMLLRQVYCHNGHELVLPTNPRFDGELGIKLLCETTAGRGILYLSPFHKDHRKQIEKISFEEGEIVTLMCPQCEEPLQALAPHDCQEGAMYVSLYLSPEGDIHNSASVCNAWGCHSSFLRLSSEVITDLRACLSPFDPPI